MCSQIKWLNTLYECKKTKQKQKPVYPIICNISVKDNKSQVKTGGRSAQRNYQ